MRPSHTLAAVVSLVLSVAAQGQEAASPDFQAGEPVVVHNLAVVPLYTSKPPPYDDFLVLEEAQASRAVAVREVQNGQVNRLTVKNSDPAKRPLYLLGGEVVLGGKQDRMMEHDAVVEAGAPQTLSVFCVEQGRWEGRDLTFRAGGAIAHPDLRKAAFKGQGQVWGEVARKSAASNVHSATGTYRRVVQDEAVRQRIAGYLDELKRQVPASDRLAGYAVAINGELELVDVFDSPPLFAKLERKLLASYVLAALERQPGSEERAGVYQKKAKALKNKDVQQFVDESAAPASTSAHSETSKVFRHKGKAVHGSYFGKK